MVVRLRPVRFAGPGRLRADRERRPRRGRGGAGRPQGVRAVLRQAGDPERADPLRLMVDYASRAATRARRRETTDVASFVRRLDWILIGSVAALVAYGLWAIADITRHDVVTNPHYYFTHQAAYAAAGGVCLIAWVLPHPDGYPTRWREIFGGMRSEERRV